MTDTRVYNLIVTRDVISCYYRFPASNKLIGRKHKINGKWDQKWTVWPKGQESCYICFVPRRYFKYDKHPTRKEVIPMPKKKGGKKGSCK